MAEESEADRSGGVGRECDDHRACWELQDSERFTVEISPWPPRAGTSILIFPEGPDCSHLRYAIRTVPPIHEECIETRANGLRSGIVTIDRTPWEWMSFSSDGFSSDGPPFRASVELPPGQVWIAFLIDLQDELGEWYEYPPLDDWVLEVGENEPA